MDSTNIELPGSRITAVTLEGDRIAIRFEPAYLVKIMTGSVERTRWWQNGALVFEGAALEGELPPLPATCSGGDLGENIYTYRDMVPIPLASRGRVHCDLGVEGSEARIRVSGDAVYLEMEGVPRYIEHLRPE